MAVMLLAAAVSYLGLPQIAGLCRADLGGMAVFRVMDNATALRLARQLEQLAPDCPQAAELKSDLVSGTEALNSIEALPQILAAPAPALARSSLSYVPPRPTMDRSPFLGALAALSVMVLPQCNRPPPDLRSASAAVCLISQFRRAALPVRAPPLCLR